MKTLKHWELAGQDEAGVDLRVDGKHLFSLRVLEQGLFRVFIQRNGELALDRTWSIAPDKGNASRHDVPWEGRDRLSNEGFSLPGYQLTHGDNCLTLTTDALRVTVH